MNQLAPMDPLQLQQMVYLAFNFAFAIALITVTWILKEIFYSRLDQVGLNPRRFIALGWGWMMAELVRDVLIANVTLYILWNSGPDLARRYLTDNLPAKTNELVLIICLMFVAPLVRSWKSDNQNRRSSDGAG